MYCRQLASMWKSSSMRGLFAYTYLYSALLLTCPVAFPSLFGTCLDKEDTVTSGNITMSEFCSGYIV